MKCKFDNKFGHIIVSGRFKSSPDINNILQFEIHSDQSYIGKTIRQLGEVVKIFD